jgi:Protein of unknown function (DUF3306)
MSETFFSRWSRRKQEVRTSEPLPGDTIPAPAGDAEPKPAAERTADGGPEQLVASDAELSADEIAALPSLQDLTAETDISAFLRKGVPESTRNAALRRMWSLDPKIRDFAGDARDYAYDWNTLGGVPGNGPLPTTEAILRMAAKIVGGSTDQSVRSEGDRSEEATLGGSQDWEQPSLSADRCDAAAAEPQPSSMADEHPLHQAADRTGLPHSLTELGEGGKNVASVQPDRTDQPLDFIPRRRHGGAIPL